MSKIFCLETEWNKSLNDLKYKSSAQALLDFLQNSISVNYTFRNVATKEDFLFYIEHLEHDSYNAYDIVYLCFHGFKSGIEFANKDSIQLLEFAENHQAIFAGKNVHFGCCSSLGIAEDDIRKFKRLTGARMVSGYKVQVDFVNSFVFELWLLNAMCQYTDYAGKRIEDLAYERMSYFANKFQFAAY